MPKKKAPAVPPIEAGQGLVPTPPDPLAAGLLVKIETEGRPRFELTPTGIDALYQVLIDDPNLAKACAALGMHKAMVYARMADQPGVAKAIVHARLIGERSKLDDVLDLVSGASDRDSAAAAKVKADTLFKYLAMCSPRIYGARVEHTHGGDPANPIQHETRGQPNARFVRIPAKIPAPESIIEGEVVEATAEPVAKLPDTALFRRLAGKR